MPDFSCTPPGYGCSPNIGSQVESLLESQKEIMKVQQDLVNMVKDVSERVGDLETEVSKSVTSSHEAKQKLTPQLSVSLPYLHYWWILIHTIFRNLLQRSIIHMMKRTSFIHTKGTSFSITFNHPLISCMMCRSKDPSNLKVRSNIGKGKYLFQSSNRE